MIGVIGDVHGHLQLALCVMARWQESLRAPFEAVLICGDVGTFTNESELDNATRAHARRNPIELEFLTQWASTPQAPWLDYIFVRQEDGGLGLSCPVIMVHGNHEGFGRLAELSRPNASIPDAPVSPRDLPAVDTNGHILYLPSGWTVLLDSGHRVTGIGGIEPGQRGAAYHPMAFLSEPAIEHVACNIRTDILVTHQGPASIQGDRAGSPTLDLLLDEDIARVWFHGHSIRQPDFVKAGPSAGTLVVPLHDVAFPGKGIRADEPGQDGWAVIQFEGQEISPVRSSPECLREFRRHRWMETTDGLLVAPPLKNIAWKLLHKGSV